MAKRRRETSEETIVKSWERYNQLIEEEIAKARAKGKDIDWKFERIETLGEYRAAYKAQQSSNRFYAEKSKSKQYKGKENITRQLFRKSKIWTRNIITRYAKIIGLSTAEAEYGLGKMTRQELFQAFLDAAGNDYDIAAANYRSIVYNENTNPIKEKEAREAKYND